jgi:hypothetical protein
MYVYIMHIMRYWVGYLLSVRKLSGIYIYIYVYIYIYMYICICIYIYMDIYIMYIMCRCEGYMLSVRKPSGETIIINLITIFTTWFSVVIISCKYHHHCRHYHCSQLLLSPLSPYTI